MNYGEILSRRASFGTRNAARAMAHRHLHPGGVSRRLFIQQAAGAAAAGAVIGSPRRADAGGPGIGLVVPIPTTLPVFGEEIHVQAPPFTGPDSDPSTVFDFRGSAGIAFINGTVQRTDRRTGESRMLPYSFNDMRFMQGRFRGTDGHVRGATFVFT
jgi:hypothetical protein